MFEVGSEQIRLIDKILEDTIYVFRDGILSG
jgi:hypothetical protein